MQKSSGSDTLLSIGQVAEILEISIDTARRWDKKGILNAVRSDGGHRRFRKSDILLAKTHSKPKIDLLARNLKMETVLPVASVFEKVEKSVTLPVLKPHRLAYAVILLALAVLVAATGFFLRPASQSNPEVIGEEFKGVLAASTIPGNLEINVDTTINGKLLVNDLEIEGQTLIYADTTATLTNKTIDASKNTLTSIPNSALVNSKVSLTSGTNLTGGGDVSLGGSVSLALKNDITLNSASMSSVFVAGVATVSGNLLPLGDRISDLGSITNYWNQAYIDTLHVDNFVGDIGFWQEVSGTVSPVNITDDVLVGGISTATAKLRISGLTGNITAGTWNGSTIGIGYGGTGVTSLSDILGTTNQVTVSGGTGRVIGGNVTLSLPNDLQLVNATLSGTLMPTVSLTQDIGSAANLWGNIYAKNFYTGGGGTAGFWQRTDGVVAPAYLTDDLVLGGLATASAKFQVSGTTGTVSSGTWQAGVINSQYGGTGQDWHLTAQGNVPYFSATGTLATLAPGTTNQIFITGGTNANPSWANLYSLLSAGTDITLGGSTIVTINDASTLQTVTGRGASTSNPISLTASGTAITISNNATISGTLGVNTGISTPQVGSTAFGNLTLGDSQTGGVLIAPKGISGLFVNGTGNVQMQNSLGFLTLALSDNYVWVAANTVDKYAAFGLPQATAGQTVTLPSPTDTTAGKLIYLSNTGSTSFTFLGSSVLTGTTTAAVWNGTAWTLAGGGGLAQGTVANSTLRWNSPTSQWLENINFTSDSSGNATISGLLDTNQFKLNIAPSAGYVLVSDATGIGTWQSITGGAGGIGGSGTLNYLSKFTPDGTHIGNSGISDTGTLITLSENATASGSFGVGGILTVPQISGPQGTLAITGTLTGAIWNGAKISELYGGTNQTTYVKGDILYASGTDTLAKLPIGSLNQALVTNVSGIPAWATITGGTGGFCSDCVINDPTTSTINTIIAGNATTTPLTLKGALNQTANLFTVLNSTGDTLARIDSAGNASISGTLGVDTKITTPLLAGTAMQSLTIGDANTGSIIFGLPISSATISGILGVGGEASLSAKLILGGITPQINATNMRNLQLGFQNTGRVEFMSPANFIDAGGNMTLAGTLNGVSASLGTITNSTWNGNIIGTQYGGTGQDWHLVAQGSLPYFNGTGAMTTLGVGAASQVLTTSGAGADPAWTNMASLISQTGNISITGTQTLTVNTIMNPTFTTSVTTPLVDNSGTLGIGITNQTGLTLGRVGAATTINGSSISLSGDITQTGNATISGTLGVGGNIQIDANLNIKGDVTLNKITAGTWNATQIGATYGGTGQTIYAVGDILSADTTTTLSKIADVATGNVLISGGVNTLPSWGKAVLGVNTSGNYVSQIIGTANQITASAATGDVTLSIPTDFRITDATLSGTLGVGGNTTLNGDLLVKGNTNLVTGSAYQINGASVLNATTLGSGVTGSSLTSVGILTGGSIASGFGTIATANTITGTTLNGTTGINTGATAGTERIDASGNLTNIGTASMSGALTLTTTPTIGTTSMQILTLGGANTGSVQLSPKSTTGLFVNGLGNVGIGTTGPSNKLDVYGGNLRVSSVNAQIILRDRNTLAANNGPVIAFSGNEDWDTGMGQIKSGWSAASNLNTYMGFSTRNAGTVMEQVRIDSSGNVGIGTTSPLAKLDVNGTASISGALSLYGTPTIGTTGMQSLTLGDATTGNIILANYATASGVLGAASASISGKITMDSLTNQINATNNRSLDLGFMNTGRINFLTTSSYVDASGNFSTNGQVQVGNFASAPTALGAGSLYFNTGDSNLYAYNGSTWGAIGGWGLTTATNTSGGTLAAKALVIFDPANNNSVTTTTTPYRKAAYGVVTSSCDNAATCNVQIAGAVNVTVSNTTTVAKGDYVYTSSTAGSAVTSAKLFDGMIGVVTDTSTSGSGYVKMVFAPQAQVTGGVAIDKGSKHNEYWLLAKNYLAMWDGTSPNQNIPPRGLMFDNFSDLTKVDSALTTVSGASGSAQIGGVVAPFRMGLTGGQTMATSTTDNAGNTYLGSNTVNKVFYYDRTRDSIPQVQVELGIDPNWYNGVTLSVATTSANFSQNTTIVKNPSLSTTYNGSLVKVTGTYASNAKTIYITVNGNGNSFAWTDYNGNAGIAAMTPGTAQTLVGTVAVTFSNAKYNPGDVFKIGSWVVEPTGSTRGTKTQFPERSNIIATASSVDIIDADTQKLWMRFSGDAAGGDNLISSLGYSTNVASSINAINGTVYVSVNGGANGGNNAIRFSSDNGNHWAVAGYYLYKGSLSQRNSTLGKQLINSSFAIVNQATNDVSAAVIPNQPTQTVTVSGWGYIAGAAATALSETVNLPYKFNNTPIVQAVYSGLATSTPTKLGSCNNDVGESVAPDAQSITTSNFLMSFRMASNFNASYYYCYTWTATGQVSPRQYVAAATNGGVSVINETDQSVINGTYSTRLSDYVALAQDGTLYYSYGDSGRTWNYLKAKYKVAGLSSSWDISAVPDYDYTGTSIPSLLGGTGDNMKISTLSVTSGTSTVNGKSNTIYVGGQYGLTVIQEKQSGATAGDGTDETNGSVKYYTKDYVTEEMVGDIRGMWPLSANGAISMADASVKANTLTNNGSVTAATGVRGAGASFNGSSQYLSSTNASLLLTSNFTIGAWVNYTASGDAKTIFGTGNWLLGSRNDACGNSNLQFGVYNLSWTCADSNISPQTGKWYFVTATHDGATIKIYVNGVLSGSASKGVSSGITEVDIGRYTAGTTNYFNGTIDEPFVTATVLTPGQIKHMYEIGYRALQSHSGGDTNQQLAGTTNVVGDARPDYNNQFLYVGTNSTTLGAVSKIDLNSDTNVKTYNASANVPVGGTLLADEDTKSLAVGYNLEAVGSAASGVVSMAPNETGAGATSGNLVSKTLTTPESFNQAYLWAQYTLDSSDASNTVAVWASNDGGSNYYQCNLTNTDANQTPNEYEYFCQFNTAGSSLKTKFVFARGSTKTNTYVTRYGIAWIGTDSVVAGTAGNGLYTNNNATVANGSYIDVAHNQGTNDVVTDGWVYDSNLSRWVKIDSNVAAGPNGTGTDGACTIASGSTNITTGSCAGRPTADAAATYVSTTAAAGSTSLTINSCTGFGVGDEILLIQMIGTGAGNYEYRTVTSCSAGTLTVNKATTNAYTKTASTSLAQVARVPNYSSVSVSSGATLTASAWDGTTNYVGGIIIFRSRDGVTNAGTIDANSLGGPGGGAGAAGGGGNGGTLPTYVGSNGTAGGAGSASTVSGAGNGGAVGGSVGNGASTGWYAGSGAGGTGGAGGGGSYGTAGTAGGNGTSGAGGSGGNYNNGTANNGATGSAGTGGTAGSTIGDAGLTTLFLGAGGGGGAGGHGGGGGLSGGLSGTGGNGGAGGAGGAGGVGGGIIFIGTTTFSNTGTVRSNGGGGSAGSSGSAGSAGVNCNDTAVCSAGGGGGSGGAPGGGGSGGSIFVQAISVNTTGTFTATGGNGSSTGGNGGNGGKGGNQANGSGWPSAGGGGGAGTTGGAAGGAGTGGIGPGGPGSAGGNAAPGAGGTGGSGRVRVEAPTTPSGTINPSASTATTWGTQALPSTGSYVIQQIDTNTVRLYNYSGATQNLRLDVITGGLGRNLGTVSLAASAADVDTQNNMNSIWVNKTGTGGTLLKLQQSGADVLNLSSSALTLTGNFLPGTDNTYSLGSSPSARWKDLFLGPASLHILGKTTDAGLSGIGQNVDYGFGVNATGKLSIALNNTNLFAIDQSGNASASGSITAGSAGFKYADGTSQTTAAAGESSGQIAAFATACPTGWTEYTAARGRTVVGTPGSGTNEGTVGTALTNLQDKTHTHTGPSHSHTYSGTTGQVQGDNWPTGFINSSGDHSHTHAFSGTTSSAGTGATGTSATSDVIPYIQLTYCSKNAGADLAEWVPTSEDVSAATIVSVDPANNEKLVASKKPYDSTVVGIIATKPGWLIGDETPGSAQMALAGRVPTRVTLKNGDINRGDAITTSDIAGVGMKATKAGSIIGKAMEPLNEQSALTDCGNGDKCGIIAVFVNVSYFDPATSQDQYDTLVATSQFIDESIIVSDTAEVGDMVNLRYSMVENTDQGIVLPTDKNDSELTPIGILGDGGDGQILQKIRVNGVLTGMKSLITNGVTEVNIASTSAEIKKGDLLGMSEINGKAKKSTTIEPIIGKALEDWTPESGRAKIRVLVDPGTNILAIYAASTETTINIATVSAQMDKLTADVSTILSELPQIKSDIEMLKEEMASVSARLAKAESSWSPEGAIGSSSAALADAIASLQHDKPLDIATMSAMFGTFTESLKVIGTTQLADTSIGGKLTIGLIQIDDLTAEISSLTGTVTIVGTLKSKTVETEGISLKDDVTGDYYCIRMHNGEINKMVGKCE